MMKLSSSWPSGLMFAESVSGVTSRANFSAELRGGNSVAADLAEEADWIINSMSRAISSPETSVTGGTETGAGGGGGTNSIRGCGAIELTAAVAVAIGMGG